MVDMARKVVGVGSVGTRAFIVLLQGRDERRSALPPGERGHDLGARGPPAEESKFAQPGERVVQGQRLMQAASDIYLGWTKGGEADRFLYWRQLRDMKGSALVEQMSPIDAHLLRRPLWLDPGSGPRPVGDAVALAAYLGKSDKFDKVNHRLLGPLRGSERAGL